MNQDWALVMELSSKALKEFKTDVQKLLLSLFGNLGNVNRKPKYSEQIYLDLRPYQEELSGKLPTNSKLLSELMKSPWKAQGSLSIGLGLSGNEKCMKMAVKWPGHFSIKFRILSYKPKLLAWAYWHQIRAQEQKTRSKSELRLSLEPSVNNDIFTLSISRMNENKKRNKQKIFKKGLWASYELNKLTQISSELFQKLCWAFWHLVILTSKGAWKRPGGFPTKNKNLSH